jgi:hypothetical protein
VAGAGTAGAAVGGIGVCGGRTGVTHGVPFGDEVDVGAAGLGAAWTVGADRGGTCVTRRSERSGAATGVVGAGAAGLAAAGAGAAFGAAAGASFGFTAGAGTAGASGAPGSACSMIILVLRT